MVKNEKVGTWINRNNKGKDFHKPLSKSFIPLVKGYFGIPSNWNHDRFENDDSSIDIEKIWEEEKEAFVLRIWMFDTSKNSCINYNIHYPQDIKPLELEEELADIDVSDTINIPNDHLDWLKYEIFNQEYYEYVNIED